MVCYLSSQYSVFVSGDFKQIIDSSAVNGLEKSALNENFIESREVETTFLDLETFVSHVYGLLFKASAKSDALAHFLMALANRYVLLRFVDTMPAVKRDLMK